MKRILALDGGGMDCIMSAAWLAQHGYSGKDFDLIVGTSGGGLNALMLADDIAPARIVEFYQKHGRQIFRRRPPYLSWVLIRERYSPAGLESAAREVFGDRFLSTLKHEVLLPAMRFNAFERGRQAFFFRRNSAFPILDAALATSAAPTYFPPHAGWDGAFVWYDGGVVANNPADCAMAEGRKMWGDEALDILSIGSGLSPLNSERSVPRAPWRWVLETISGATGGRVGVTDTILQWSALGATNLGYTRIDFPMEPGKAPAMDCATPEAMAYRLSRVPKFVEKKIEIRQTIGARAAR